MIDNLATNHNVLQLFLKLCPQLHGKRVAYRLQIGGGLASIIGELDLSNKPQMPKAFGVCLKLNKKFKFLLVLSIFLKS